VKLLCIFVQYFELLPCLRLSKVVECGQTWVLTLSQRTPNKYPLKKLKKQSKHLLNIRWECGSLSSQQTQPKLCFASPFFCIFFLVSCDCACLGKRCGGEWDGYAASFEERAGFLNFTASAWCFHVSVNFDACIL
jgi:hypothetical protein